MEEAGKPRKADGLEIHAVGNQVVVYEVQADRLHYLNPTAALILELCDGDHSPAEIAALVQEAYELPIPPCGEVDTCVADLKRKGIVA